MKSFTGLAQRDAWVDAVDHYEGYVESPYAKLADVMRSAGLARARVGFEQDYVSARDWEDVQRRLPQLVMVDCTGLMNRVRWIKTPGEVELIRKAADLLDDVYLEVFQRIRPDDTERCRSPRARPAAPAGARPRCRCQAQRCPASPRRQWRPPCRPWPTARWRRAYNATIWSDFSAA